MNVFISWSGEPVQDFALFLRNWLRHVVQAVKPFMSEQDIAKGSRNVVEMSKVLEGTEFGIVVVTRHNMQAPWMNFEAGTISRSVAGGRLVPFLLDVPKAEVVGPLAQFQAVDANEPAEILRLFQEINRCLAEPLEADVLQRSVAANLPALHEALRVYRDHAGTAGSAQARPEKDMLAEVLVIVRELHRTQATPHPDRVAPVRPVAALPGSALPGSTPPSVSWRQDLARLDSDLAGGRLSADEYGRLRAALLARLADELSDGTLDWRDDEGNEQ